MITISGCAALHLNGNDSGEYVSKIGQATGGDIDEMVPRILRENDFELYRVEQRGRGKYFETYWLERPLLEDEESIEGISESRTRIKITTNIAPSSFNTTYYNVTFIAENQFKKNSDGTWVSGKITDMAERRLYNLERDFRMRMTEGTRRY